MKGGYYTISHKTAVVTPDLTTNLITVQGQKRSRQATPTPSERSARLTNWFASSHRTVVS